MLLVYSTASKGSRRKLAPPIQVAPLTRRDHELNPPFPVWMSGASPKPCGAHLLTIGQPFSHCSWLAFRAGGIVKSLDQCIDYACFHVTTDRPDTIETDRPPYPLRAAQTPDNSRKPALPVDSTDKKGRHSRRCRPRLRSSDVREDSPHDTER